MERVYTPLHDASVMNDDWWLARGFKLHSRDGQVWRNEIRDGSGRYDGYILILPDCSARTIRTEQEGIDAVVLYSQQRNAGLYRGYRLWESESGNGMIVVFNALGHRVGVPFHTRLAAMIWIDEKRR